MGLEFLEQFVNIIYTLEGLNEWLGKIILNLILTILANETRAGRGRLDCAEIFL